ncbi:hypothetical protein [Ralstonia solanacearum]|nr:hypothetical protein [Ralstonia solanacearum]MCL9844259.1 hypothetical protein [Ralstonia solanacearum]MCL9856062.1 hypothetical protein [Ralstonia solanacearum]MCL9861452.1 hypothetical protein [Ralstonia solanacearum]MCL9865760.1 hypothetical protein [Ralstonia solanacearum]MCL9870530.1 hypothetical protein [Ralstonia solanacearum]
MRRIGSSTSSAASSSSVGAETSNGDASNSRTGGNLRQRSARARDGVLTDMPTSRGGSSRAADSDAGQRQPRISAAMDQVWGGGQTLANAGARAARVGGQVGLALGQHALDNPLLTAGFGGFAAGNYRAYQAVQRNDVPAYAGAAAMTLMGTGMILAGAICSLLQGNPARLQVDA